MIKLIIHTTLLLSICVTSLAQQQLNNWYIAPHKVLMTTITPSALTITPLIGTAVTATANQSANGFYDNNGTGDLIFYVADGGVYDYNNTLIGNIENGATEIAIVPFGTNSSNPCQNKYNIFSTSAGFTNNVGLFQSVLDMNSYSVTTTEIDAMPFGSEFGSIAVGKANANGNRFLYFLVGSGFSGPSGQINKLVINNNGTVSSSVPLYPTTTLINNNSGIEVFTRELDLSSDGRWLAWASYITSSGSPTLAKYHFLALDNSTGDANIAIYGSAAYQQFNIAAAADNYVSAGFRGVEFFQSGSNMRLFMGAGQSGIYYNNISIPFINAPVWVTGSNGSSTLASTFGLSQLELAHSNNGFMYASSGNPSNNIGAFIPSSNTPQMLSGNSFYISNPPKAAYIANPNPISSLYTLPDQIDGQDYSLITSAAVAPVVTYNTLTFPSNGGNGQSATWTYGSNPVINATSPIHIIHELRIKQNSTVTIKGMTFKFSPEAKVIIEEGSTLILDELSGTPTIFTSNSSIDHCPINYSWQGVEVWGTSNLSQIPPLAPALFKQGKLVMKNYSRIENANWGARAWKPIFPIPTTITSSGGIIQVSNYGEFRNCKVDVEFKPYENIFVGIKRANKSAFTFAKFTNSFSQYPFSTAPEHVIVEGCNGIRFSDCEFLHDGSQGMFDLQSKGIKSLNSNFVVTRNTFENLYHGIDAKRTTGTTTFSVYHSSFINNQTGISSSGINRITLQKNHFFIGRNLKTGATTQVGISNVACSGYIIEENEFEPSNLAVPSVSKWGIITSSSLYAPNQIYKNTFTNINYGNVSQGVNRDNSISNAVGLQYLCNVNTSNVNYDFYVSHKGGSIVGIATNQGTSSYPAQNSFSNTGPLGSYSDFNNSSSNPINYYYNQTSYLPIHFNFPLLSPFPTLNSNSCPSHICPPPCDVARLLTALEVEQFSSMYDSAETGYINLLYSYNQLMDGGSTNILLNQMQLEWSDDANTLRDELLAMSPYLSQDVLMEVARGDVLPPAMLLMICLANPDATRRTGFLDFLQYEIPSPLPQYMINLIVVSWDDGTSRTALESMLTNFNVEMATASNRILEDLQKKMNLEVDSVSQDDTTNYLAEINYWLNRIQTLSAKYDLIENYLIAEDYLNAEIQLSQIPENFRLSADQSQEYSDYTYFYFFRKSLLESNSSLQNLDSAQLASLISFSQGEINIAKCQALNALCFYFGICTEEDYSLSEGNRMMNSNAPTSLNIDADKIDASVYVTPNPASSYTSIIYNIYPMSSPAILVICDITGREEIRFNLVEATDQLYWDTSNVLSGTYYYSLQTGNTNLSKGKIVVKR
jgi:hypothetical protein